MKRSLIVLIALALASSVAAVTPYSEFRQDHPGINDAIAAAPSSDLHGTFNRLSALYNRSPIDNAPVDAGYNNDLPANFLRNLEATLIDLQEDLGKDEVSGLSPLNKAYLLAAVRTYAVRRPLALWQSANVHSCEVPPPCPNPAIEGGCPGVCLDNDPAVINEVQRAVIASRPVYRAVYDSVAPADRGGLVLHGSLSAENFIAQIGLLLTIKGVESIDD